MLLSQTVDARGGAGAGAEVGGGAEGGGSGAEPMEVSSESEEDTSEQDTDMQEKRQLGCWECAKLREFALNVMIGGASRKPNTRGKIIEDIA